MKQFTDFIKSYIPKHKEEQEIKRIPNHINLQVIKQLKSKDKFPRAYLLKNNLIAYVIQSPLYLMYEKEEITTKQFMKGLSYGINYIGSLNVNIKSSSYFSDVLGINTKGGFSKQPTYHYQVGASKKLINMQKELTPLQIKILNCFIGEEMSVRLIKETLKLGHYKIKKEIINSLKLLSA